MKIVIYNLAGEQIATIEQSNPDQSLVWATKNSAPGIYVYQTILTVNGQEKRLGMKKLAIVQ